MTKDHYKILGVDPGTQVLGYAVIEIQKQNISVLDIGEIHLTNMKITKRS